MTSLTREAVDAAAAADGRVVRDAIERYHDLLGQDGMAEETGAAVEARLREREMVFGGRPLCTVLRPRFVTRDGQRRLEGQIRPLLAAFARSLERAMANPEFRRQYRLTDWEESLVARDPHGGPASPTSRLDAFVMPDTGAMAITEYNAETPAGAAFTDALVDAFVDVPAMRRFARDYEFVAPPSRPGVLRVLLDAWERWSGSSRAPTIAILDWREVPTSREFELFRDYFASRGLKCVIADPREAEYRDGRLWCEGEPIDLIYKRVLIAELVEREGVDGPVVRAVLDRAVCMVNSFRCKVLHKKASLAVLSDESNAGLFDARELAAIRAHVPWTRVVEDRATTYGGERIELLSWTARNRERLVLKPNDDYGGAGIVLGWEVSDSAWEGALRAAVDSPYIVQERVAIPSEAFPSLVDGRLVVADRMVDTAPFVCDGRYSEGALCRLASQSLINVSAGGGSSVPVFVVEGR